MNEGVNQDSPGYLVLEATTLAMRGDYAITGALVANPAALATIASLRVDLTLPLAERLADAHMDDLSIPLFEALISHHPADSRLLSSFGTKAPGLAPDEALVYFQRALEMDETNEQAVIGVANLQWPAGGQPEACMNTLEVFFRGVSENVAGSTSDALNDRTDVLPPNEVLKEKLFLDRADMAPHLSRERWCVLHPIMRCVCCY